MIQEGVMTIAMVKEGKQSPNRNKKFLLGRKSIMQPIAVQELLHPWIKILDNTYHISQDHSENLILSDVYKAISPYIGISANMQRYISIVP